MVKRSNSSGKVRTEIVDREVGDPDHDTLCTWLISNLDKVVQDLFGAGEDEMRRMIAETASEHREELRNAIEQLAEMSAEHRQSCPELSELADAKAKEVREALASVRELDPTGRFGSARLVEWTAQQPIYEASRRNPMESHLVGYVDVTAVVDPFPGFALDYCFPLPDRDGFFFDQEPDDDFEKLQKDLAEWTVPSSEWRAGSKPSINVFFDVRARNVILEELLRDLKTLRGLVGQDSRIVVVVSECSAHEESILRHEGFLLVRRSAWSLDGKKLS